MTEEFRVPGITSSFSFNDMHDEARFVAAAMAMKSLIITSQYEKLPPYEIADLAVKHADALLEALSRPTSDASKSN